nr:MAG: hypothetical protein [Bacteriophage sp.]
MKIINQLVVQSDMPNDNNVVWVYGNTAKYYNNGTWTTLGESNEDRKELEEKVDSLDKEMGEVKKDLSILGSKQDVVELEIGDSNEIKTNNLKKLQSIQTNDHTFFTDINYGYGTASWLPASGGNALIITSEGHAVKYTISKDGEVTKGEEFTLKDFTSELNNKVDKVEGKQLSTNDYTTAEKNKLANLQNFTLEAATKTKIGGVKAITNIADLNADTATIGQVAGVVNNLLGQLRTSGLIQA